jgi:condensin complex subunit 2
MAPKTARLLDARNSDGDTDIDTDGDHETPKRSRQHLKKRLSEIHHDHGGPSDHGRSAARSVNKNDDAAEKRRRRKSNKLAVLENSQGGPSSEGGQNPEQDQPEGSWMAKQKQQLTSVAQTPVINVPLDIMSSNFEEWMKMATDNVLLYGCANRCVSPVP